MSSCVKTGAVCYINEYRATVNCDVHSTNGDVVVVRFNPYSFQHGETTKYDLSMYVGEGYFDRQAGVIVTKASCIDFKNEVIKQRIDEKIEELS